MTLLMDINAVKETGKKFIGKKRFNGYCRFHKVALNLDGAVELMKKGYIVDITDFVDVNSSLYDKDNEDKLKGNITAYVRKYNTDGKKIWNTSLSKDEATSVIDDDSLRVVAIEEMTQCFMAEDERRTVAIIDAYDVFFPSEN